MSKQHDPMRDLERLLPGFMLTVSMRGDIILVGCHATNRRKQPAYYYQIGSETEPTIEAVAVFALRALRKVRAMAGVDDEEAT